MPSRSDYDKAILFSQVRLKVSNPDLREGQVQTVKGGTMPWGNQGSFAVVYKFRTRSGKDRALRCFINKTNTDTKQRYELIGPYFKSRAPEITADFVYYDQGIEISEMIQGQPQNNVYPVIDMEWVDGVTLFDQAEKLCKQRDQAALSDLAMKWFEVTQRLRMATMAHGDLAAVNVMVRSDGRLVLVDYDSAYIPAFRGKQQDIKGTRGFQHPQMSQRSFDEWMDEFSGLVIFTALLALKAQPTLWDTYVKYGTGGRSLDQTLLFTHEDFEHPQQSALFSELERSPDKQVREVVADLKQACLQNVAQVRFPVDKAGPDYAKKLALEILKQAIAANEDERIVKTWAEGLDSYPLAQPHRPRWELAASRMQALETFRNALQTRLLKKILADYNAPLLDPCQSVTTAEREMLRLARQFDAALLSNVEDRLVAAWNAIEQSPHAGMLNLTASERQQLDVAQHHQRQLDELRAALAGNSIAQIAVAFDPVLLSHPGVTPQELQALQEAQAFQTACRDENDEAIEMSAVRLRSIRVNNRALTFSPSEEQRAQLAAQRNAAIKGFRRALQSKRPDQIAAAYDVNLLGASGLITTEERQKGDLAKEWQEGTQRHRDDLLIKVWDAVTSSGLFRGFLDFLPGERARVDQARQRQKALVGLRTALTSRDIDQILAAYIPLLPLLQGSQALTPEEQTIVDHAQNFQQACQGGDDLAIDTLAQQIRQTGALQFTPAQKKRIQDASERKQALQKFQGALQTQARQAQEIVDSYDASLLDPCKNVSASEQSQLATARRFLQMRQDVLAAIRAGTPQRATSLYNEHLAAQFDDLTPEERKLIEGARKSVQLERALAAGDHLLALQMAQEIEQVTGISITDERVRLARQRFVSSCHPQNVRVKRFGDFVEVRWDWPASTLIEKVAIVWRPDRFPRSPEDVPREATPAQLYYCSRAEGAAFNITVGYAPRVHVQVFAALMDVDPVRREQHWYYSDGQEDTSRKSA